MIKEDIGLKVQAIYEYANLKVHFMEKVLILFGILRIFVFKET